MSIIQGLYKVEFATQLGSGSGVVLMSNGTIHGGDSIMYYTGTYSESGDEFNATVSVARHTAGSSMFSVLGVDNGALLLTGRSNGGTVEARGSTPQNPGISFQATLTKLLV